MRIESMVFCLILGGLISALIIPVMLLPDLMHSIQLRKGKKRRSTSSPRFGGVALVLAFLGVIVLSCLLRPSALSGPESVTLHLIWGALAMVFLGVWNDYKQPATVHLLVLQSVVAAGLFTQGIQLESFEGVADGPFTAEGLSSLVITVSWIVALTNLPRLMDKVTGLAGGVGGVALALVTLGAYRSEAALPALWGAGMTGALAGFLFYSLPPTRVRLGGAGSSLIGFLLGCLTILAAGRTSVLGSSVIPFFVVMLLILSAGFAVLRRDLTGMSLLPSGRRADQERGLSPRGVKPHVQ